MKKSGLGHHDLGHLVQGFSKRGITRLPLSPMSELEAIVNAAVPAGSCMMIRAVAGAGKSFALREFARARPSQRFLFLSFNESVRREKTIEFKTMQLSNIMVQTLHSFAHANTPELHMAPRTTDTRTLLQRIQRLLLQHCSQAHSSDGCVSQGRA